MRKLTLHEKITIKGYIYRKDELKMEKLVVAKVGNPYDDYMIYSEETGETVVNTVKGKERATLFAASPKMLKALKEAREYRLQTHHGDDECLRMLDEIITEAEDIEP